MGTPSPNRCLENHQALSANKVLYACFSLQLYNIRKLFFIRRLLKKVSLPKHEKMI